MELDNQSRRHTRKGEPEAPKWFIPSKAEVSFVQRSLGRGHAQVTDSSPQRTANPPPTEGVCSDPKRSSGVGEVGVGASLRPGNPRLGVWSFLLTGGLGGGDETQLKLKIEVGRLALPVLPGVPIVILSARLGFDNPL